MAYYHRPMNEHMSGPRRELHAHMALGQHTWSNDVERGMPLSPRVAHMFGRRQA